MSVLDKKENRQMMQLMHIFGVPLYFFAFTVIFRPEAIVAILGEDEFIGRAASASMELLVSLIFMRFLYRHFEGRVNHLLWCVLEMSVMSFVFAFIIGFDMPVFVRSLSYVFLVLALPQWAVYTRVALAESLRRNEELSAGDRMKFHDENGKLKIAIAADDVIYIQADDNYIRIHYLADSVVREFVIRTSMKGIEDLCQYHGILRSHRSYFVNPRHVTWLGRDDNDEVYAILDIPDMPHIPVTKRYFDRIAEKFS